MTNYGWIILLIILIILCIYFFPRREYYGGPVKKIRRIPRSECYNICGQYFRDCMARSQYTDAGICHNRLNNCIAQCNYTDFHRL